jgi:hypothetical protein
MHDQSHLREKIKAKLLVVSPPLNGHRRRPATWANKVRQWCMLRARYKMLEGDRRGPGGPVAHRDSPEVVEAEDCCRIRARLCQFRRDAAEGNGENPLIKPMLDQFLQLVGLTRRDGSLENHVGASDGL